MESELIHPKEFNEDAKNFNQKHIAEFERIRTLSVSYEEYEKNIDLYNNWFETYENDLKTEIYRGPEMLASMCNIYVCDKSAKILDVGAGTGLVGHFLVKNGFKYIDALDPSVGMLKLLKEKNIYNKIYFEGLKVDDTVSIEEGFYDAIVTCGTIGEGYLPIETIREFLRIVKSDGYIMIMMPEVYWDVNVDFDAKIESYLDKLVNNGICARVTKITAPRYYFWKKGTILVIKKI